MKRLQLNGSPRGHNSNSALILSWVSMGMEEAIVALPPMLDLAKVSELEIQRKAFLEADEVLLAFPLYTDSMPGIVKNFFESLASAKDPAKASDLKDKRLAFIVQSGFPESIHSEAIADYLSRLVTRLGCTHAGTIIKGGVEGIRMMPLFIRDKLKKRFMQAGRELATFGGFSAQTIDDLAKPRRLSLPRRFAMALLRPTGLVNIYWNVMLKKNNAFKRRFDAPYAHR